MISGIMVPAAPTEQQGPINEQDLVNRVVRAIGQRLPRSWSAIEARTAPGNLPSDAALEITAPDGQASRVAFEIKRRITSADVGRLVERWSDDQRVVGWNGVPVLVTSDYISPPVRERLADNEISFVDATGNLRLQLDIPGLFVEATGASTDPWRSPTRAISGLRKVPAARVVRALADFTPPYSATELARLAKVSIGSVYRVLTFLEREGLVTRNGSGQVVDVDVVAMLRRWSEDYEFTMRKSSPRQFVALRGPEEIVARLRDAQWRYVVTGSFAAADLAPYAEARQLVLFASDPALVAEAFQLHPASGPANVAIAVPYDEVVFERARRRNGVWYAAPSQIAVDLLTGPGRNPSEGDELLRWMLANEGKWRSRPDG